MFVLRMHFQAVYSDYEPDWTYSPVRPYVPANITHTCSKARRSRSSSATRVARSVTVATSYGPSLPPRPIPRKKRYNGLLPPQYRTKNAASAKILYFACNTKRFQLLKILLPILSLHFCFMFHYFNFAFPCAAMFVITIQT